MDRDNTKTDTAKLLSRALRATLCIMLLTLVPMALTLYFKDKFDISKLFIVALSQFVVGIPCFYFIGKYSNKPKNKDD